MDRSEMEQLRDKVGELLRFGSSSCVQQAHNIMITNFETLLIFALNLTEPKPKPKHTIADNYPAGGLTATEPCMFCEDYEQLQDKNERLRDALGNLQTWSKAYPLTVFPKPDLKKAQEALKAVGMTLDAISADAMRHVLSGVEDIVKQALQYGE